MRFSHRDSLWFGLSFVALGIIVALCGHLRSAAALAETTGVITEASILPGDVTSGPRLLNYQYTVAGEQHSGQGWLRYSARQNDALETGKTIAVFYERAHPLVSYPVFPPSRMPWISGSIFLVGFGAVAIVWGWTR